MSQVIVARNAGFCPGVRTATQRLQARMAQKAPNERIFTLGQLIHNDTYTRELEEAGVRAVKATELPALAREASAAAPITVFV